MLSCRIITPAFALELVFCCETTRALTLPSLDPKSLKDVRFVADEDTRVVEITSETKSLVSSVRDEEMFSIDLTTHDLPIEFLGHLAEAKQRLIFFGKDGKRKLKISGENARSIDEMLRLYEALAKDSGVAKNGTAERDSK